MAPQSTRVGPSTVSSPFSESLLSISERPRAFDSLPTVASVPCAQSTSSIDRECYQGLLADPRCSVVFGRPCSPSLLQGVHDAIQGLETGFYVMLDVSKADIHQKLLTWFQDNPLGEISPLLEDTLREDIERDVCGFIDSMYSSPTQSSHVTLRLVLDTSSGFEELYRLPRYAGEPNELISARIDSMVSKLEYDRAYLFHTDEDVINQAKIYAGATTLAIDPATVAQEPTLSHWFSLFDGPHSLRELLLDAVVQNDQSQLEYAIETTLEMAWRFQVQLPGLARPGTTPYQFLLGAPHLYCGAPEQLSSLGHALPKSALHAKPIIWAADRSAKRFLTLLDSPRDFIL